MIAIAASMLLAATFAYVRAADTSIVISQGVDADTLDPIKTSVTTSNNVYLQMFNQLAVRDVNGKLQPALATSWARVSPTTWEFKLRRDVKFWNGDPFTSADVKFTVEKILDPAYRSQQAPRVDTIERVETPDAYTVRFITKKPTPLEPAVTRPIVIVDAKYWKERGDAYMAEHPMGSGPYVFNHWRKDEEIVLDANPNYWGGKPAIEHVIFKPIPEAGARVAALKTGAVDLITNVPYQQTLSLAGGRATRMTSAKSVRVLYIAFNTLKPGPQQNKIFRQACNYAIDVPAIIKSVLGGRAFELGEPVPPFYFGYDKNLAPYHHDLAKAKALLAQAGYPDGKGLEPLVIFSPSGRYNGDKDVATAVAGQLAEVGIKATVRNMEWTNYLGMTNRKELAPMYMLGWGNPTYDADNTFSSLLASTGLNSTFKNAEFDKLVEAGRYELDRKKREAIYARAEALLHEEAPWLFLFEYEDLYATSKRLEWQARGDEQIFVTDMKLKG